MPFLSVLAVLPLVLFLTTRATAQGPQPNYHGTAALFQNTLYYVGGRNSAFTGLPELYTLDLSSSFPVSSPPWKTGQPLAYGISECSSWVLNGGFWLEGGTYGAVVDANLTKNGLPGLPNDVVKFAGNWSTPPLPPRPFPQRRLHAAAVNSTSNIVYIVGGISDIYTGTPSSLCGGQTGNKCLQGEPYSLDVNRMLWAPLSGVGAPLVSGHAVVLASSLLYVIGGDGGSLASIPTYDTLRNAWVFTDSNGSSPSNRTGCSASLYDDGKTIIIYGGLVNSTAVDELWKFDTSTNVWTSVAMSVGVPVAYHSAILFADQLFVISGSTSAATTDGSTAFLAINITTGKSFATYIPPAANTVNFTPTTSSISSRSATQLPPQPDVPNSVIIVIACAILAVFLVLGFVMLFRAMRRKRKTVRHSGSRPESPWQNSGPDDPSVLAVPRRPIAPPHRSQQSLPIEEGAMKPDEIEIAIEEKIGVDTVYGGWKVSIARKSGVFSGEPDAVDEARGPDEALGMSRDVADAVQTARSLDDGNGNPADGVGRPTMLGNVWRSSGGARPKSEGFGNARKSELMLGPRTGDSGLDLGDWEGSR